MSVESIRDESLENLGFDPNALSEKYAEERARRLRADGNAQYLNADRFEPLLIDPWAPSAAPRDAVQREMEVLVLGGGFGGLLAAARLRSEGCKDLCIIDQASDFGGTWYWNRYPGAACDTESYIYLPMLEETGYIPSAKYAFAPEIMEHSARIGRHFDLYPSALFQTTITAMTWLEDEARWRVETNRGDVLRPRFVVLAGGPLSRPKLPGVLGIESFKGHQFHTSRWDYQYTGGSSAGGLNGLSNKRVGVIGTGATAVQCVPHLGAAAKELLLFQRTPSSVDVRNNQVTDPTWVAGLKPGWQRERMMNFTTVISGGKFDVDLVNDGWTDIITNILLAARKSAQPGVMPADVEALIQLADYRKMERVRARVDEIVSDGATAKALKPWYNQFCKRPCFHDEYLATFNRPNVQLVDTLGQGVERITEDGVVVAGREYKLDCLIFGTGFEVGTDFTRRLGFEVRGREGQTLTDKWKGGAQTLHGLFTHGFPNLFFMTTQQSGQSANFQHMLDEQSRHLAYVMKRVWAEDVKTVEASVQAEAEWVATIVKYAETRRSYLEACTPGYYNNEGRLDARTARNSQFWRGPTAFIRLLERWRADGEFAGLDLKS
jgi:cyclohexanone monooxygenase